MLKPSWMTTDVYAQYMNKHPDFYCRYPGCLECNPDEETIDHIISRAMGGTNDLSNLQPMCRRHNSMKGTRDDPYWSQEFYFDTKIAIENLRASQRMECYDRIDGMPEWFSRPFSQISQVLYTMCWVVGSGKTLAIPTLGFALNNVIRRERGPNAPRIDRILVLSKERAIRDQIQKDLGGDKTKGLVGDIVRYGINPIAPKVGAIIDSGFLNTRQLIDQCDIWISCINMLFDNNTPVAKIEAILAQFPLVIIDEPHYAVEQVLRIVEAARTSLCFGLTGSPIDARGRQLRKFVLFSMFDYQAANEFDQSMKYLVGPEHPDWRPNILDVINIESADLQIGDHTVTVGSSDDPDFGRNIRPAIIVAESVVRYVHECDEVYLHGLPLVRHDAAPHRENLNHVVDHMYPMHAMIKVETVDIGKGVCDHINRLFASEPEKFRPDRGYRCTVAHSDRTDLDENGNKKSEKGKKLGTDHPWLAAKHNDGKLTPSSSRFVVLVDMGREGLDNPMCGVIGVACHIGSWIEGVQRVLGRILRSCVRRTGSVLHVPPARLDTVKIITHDAFDNENLIERAATYVLTMANSLRGMPVMTELIEGRHTPVSMEESDSESSLSFRDKLVIASQIGSQILSGRERHEVDISAIANVFGPNPERIRNADDLGHRIIEDPTEASRRMGLVDGLRAVNRVVRESPDIEPTDETLITHIKRAAPHLADCCNQLNVPLIRAFAVHIYVENAKKYHRQSITSETDLEKIRKKIANGIKADAGGNLGCDIGKLLRLIATAMRTVLGIPKGEVMGLGSQYDIPECHVILTRPEIDHAIKRWVIRTLAANGDYPALAASLPILVPADVEDEEVASAV